MAHLEFPVLLLIFRPCQPRPGLGVIELYNPNTCTQDGKRYIFWVDVRRGDVWDPMRKPLYCRCPSPTNVTVTSPLAKATSNTDIKGNDIACNKQQYCKVCGGVSAVQNACVQNAVCLAFTYEAASKCGYLKSVRGPLVKRPGWTTFITTFTN